MIDRRYSWDLRSSNTFPSAHQLNFFTDEECDTIIALGTAKAPIESYVGSDHSVDYSIRKNQVVFFENTDSTTHWIFKKIAQGVKSVNDQFWKFDLTMIETLQFTIYSRPQDFYTAHMDMAHGRTEQRKLGFSIQLSDPESYVGSNLEFHSVGMKFYPVVRDRGAMILFPSYMVHQVTAIESGTRYSLVGWVVGPPYR